MKIILPLLFLLFSFQTAHGCRYLGYPEPPLRHIISKIGTIYIGTIISKQITYKTESGDRFRIRRMRLKVVSTMKGENKDFHEVETWEPLRKNSCSQTPTEFEVGEKWIVHDDFEQETEKRPYPMELYFGRFRRFESKESAEYLNEIGIYLKKPITAIYGQVETNLAFSGFSEVSVFLEGNNLKIDVKTGKKGEYSFKDIPAGKYRVQIRFPTKTYDMYNKQEALYNPQTQTFNIEYEADVETGESDYYYVYNTGRN